MHLAFLGLQPQVSVFHCLTFSSLFFSFLSAPSLPLQVSYIQELALFLAEPSLGLSFAQVFFFLSASGLFEGDSFLHFLLFEF